MQLKFLSCVSSIYFSNDLRGPSRIIIRATTSYSPDAMVDEHLRCHGCCVSLLSSQRTFEHRSFPSPEAHPRHRVWWPRNSASAAGPALVAWALSRQQPTPTLPTSHPLLVAPVTPQVVSCLASHPAAPSVPALTAMSPPGMPPAAMRVGCWAWVLAPTPEQVTVEVVGGGQHP